MTISIRKAALTGVAVLGTAGLLAGCGAAPEESEGGGDAGGGGGDFYPCMISDTGGFDDRSFNELGHKGLVDAAEELGVEYNAVESQAETDYPQNLQNLVDEGCDAIVTVGFLLAASTAEFAEQYPEVHFVSLDDPIDMDEDGETDFENIKPITFDTAQAAFLAGYLAAGTSEAKKVGTFGGIEIPPVTIFMDGFAQGVEYWNEQKDDSVEVVGVNTFTNEFVANDNAKQVARGVIDQGVDVLLPVGGPIYQSGAEAIRDANRDIALIGTDADVYETDPSVSDLLLTSIQKSMDVGVRDSLIAAADEFDNTPYVGTLENDGVKLAPYHDYEDRVPKELTAELEEIEQGIIAGDIEVDSYLSE